jgi:type I restriction enzyme R subunit
MCALVHKFGAGEEGSETQTDTFLQALENTIPSDFVAKGNIFVFVDECHRSQSGKLHTAMSKLLPHALFIGFTGTPLMTKDKAKSIEVFGSGILHITLN